jgi:hypothetical protein
MLDFSSASAGTQSAFIIFLLVIVFVALILELWKFFYSSAASGYLFDDTRSTFEPETYEQTNPHLMALSRN